MRYFSSLEMDPRSPASVEAHAETFVGATHHTCALTYNYLDSQKIIASVQDNGAGAVAVFIGMLILQNHIFVLTYRPGTTRDSFEGSVYFSMSHLIANDAF